MILKESGEMYLESIYILLKEKNSVRSIDVAEHMNYSKPSVSRAMKILKGQEYITIDKDGYILLTPSGKNAAEKVFERHQVLTDVLKALGVEPKVASDNACRIEHVITDDAFEAIKQYYQNMIK